MNPLSSNKSFFLGNKNWFSITQKTILFFSICISIISCTEKPTKKADKDFNMTLAFQYHVVDSGSVKNPWAKILADINGDGALDIIIGGLLI